MKMYKASTINGISVVDVVKFNDKSVWIKRGWGNENRREGRFTEYCHYYETIEEAKEYLIGVAKKSVESFLERLASSREFLEKVQALTPTKPNE